MVVETTRAGKGPLFLRGNAYLHVALRGRIAPTEIRGKMLPPLDLPKDERKRIMAEWDTANAAYYENVDWALDITQASYAALSITGVPARLIRRNAENTAVVTRQCALDGKWRNLEYNHGLFQITIWMLLEDGYDDDVLIACPRSKRYKEDIEDLQMLRDAGVAV